MQRQNSPVVTGNANTLVAGSTIAGPTLFMGESYKKVGLLSALVSITAATASLTWTGQWQVSADGNTWVPWTPENNAAQVTLATGTAAIKTVAIAAPVQIGSWAYARFVLITGAETGAAGDLYSIGYCQRVLSGLSE